MEIAILEPYCPCNAREASQMFQPFCNLDLIYISIIALVVSTSETNVVLIKVFCSKVKI